MYRVRSSGRRRKGRKGDDVYKRDASRTEQRGEDERSMDATVIDFVQDTVFTVQRLITDIWQPTSTLIIRS